MWLQLRQILKKFTEENLLSVLLFVLMLTSQKSKNTCFPLNARVQW